MPRDFGDARWKLLTAVFLVRQASQAILGAGFFLRWGGVVGSEGLEPEAGRGARVLYDMVSFFLSAVDQIPLKVK